MSNADLNEKSKVCTVTYNQSQGWEALVAGPLVDVSHPEMTAENFPLREQSGVRTVDLRVEPFRFDEYTDVAARRLEAEGFELVDNVGDLSVFARDYQEVAREWAGIMVIGSGSRKVSRFGRRGVVIPFVNISEQTGKVGLGLVTFVWQYRPHYGILVRCKK